MGGTCVASATNTCLTAPATFADIVNSVVSGMLQNMLSNNPEPTYVHQTNIMGSPPPGPATSRDAAQHPATRPVTDCCTRCSTLSSPSTTATSPPPLPSSSRRWAPSAPSWVTSPPGRAPLNAGTVTASEEDGVVTVTNNGIRASACRSALRSAPASTDTSLGSGVRRHQLGLGEPGLPAATLTIDTIGSAPAITSSSSTTATDRLGLQLHGHHQRHTGTFAQRVRAPCPPVSPSPTTETGPPPWAGRRTQAAGGSYPITLTATSEAGCSGPAVLHLGGGRSPRHHERKYGSYRGGHRPSTSRCRPRAPWLPP